MHLTLGDNLPWATLTIQYGDKQVNIPNILVDTGSASTVIASDWASEVGIVPAPEDRLYIIRGIGG